MGLNVHCQQNGIIVDISKYFVVKFIHFIIILYTSATTWHNLLHKMAALIVASAIGKIYDISEAFWGHQNYARVVFYVYSGHSGNKYSGCITDNGIHKSKLN